MMGVVGPDRWPCAVRSSAVTVCLDPDRMLADIVGGGGGFTVNINENDPSRTNIRTMTAVHLSWLPFLICSRTSSHDERVLVYVNCRQGIRTVRGIAHRRIGSMYGSDAAS